MRTRRSPRNQEKLWRELGGIPGEGQPTYYTARTAPNVSTETMDALAAAASIVYERLISGCTPGDCFVCGNRCDPVEEWGCPACHVIYPPGEPL